MAKIASVTARAVPPAVWVIAGGLVTVLLVLSPAYGFHGDELYYVVAGQHPAFGYVDQPPLTPLLSGLSVAVLGVSPTAVRVLPAIEMAAIVVLTALIARDLGGSRRAQVLAAIIAAASGYLGAGHLDTTTDPDLLCWAIILWLVVRLLAGGDRRLWLAVGAVAGIGLENKDTVLFLGAGLGIGILLARRWDVVRSPWSWAALAIAGILWAPNLAWQATNGWPQLSMARAIAGYADDNRAQVVPLLWLFTGPLLFPISVLGLAWLLVAREVRRWQPLATAALVALALVLVTGGKAYYAIGSATACIAAGAILLDRWIGRGHARLKLGGFAAATVMSGVLIGLLTLPVLPLDAFARSTLPTAVPVTAEEVGWPAFVSTVEGVVASLPADERARAVILTNDYSEASPLILLGSDLPPVYSGHNAFWGWGPPPADRTVVIHVGDWRPADWTAYFVGCRVVAVIDNGLGIPNSEQGKQVSVCTGIVGSWASLWPVLRTIS